MIYPAFIKEGSTIGICAPSAGVGKKLEEYESSLAVLKKEGYRLKETASVRLNNERGGDAATRASELMSLYQDPEVDMIMAAAGGDFLYEMLPYVDFDVIRQNPKWLMGMSDPTGLLFPVTVLCDTAAMYGMNACQYDVLPVPQFQRENLDLLKGKLNTLHSSERHMAKPKFMVDEISYNDPTVYESNQEEFHVSGRCIGGCIDALKDLIGTPLAPVPAFVEKYKEDGQIFFFDNFALSAENFYRTLLQMKLAGWFRYTKAVILGRVLLPSSETGMSYEDALRMALGDLPYIREADIGHTLPCMTLVTGAIMDLNYRNHAAEISFELR